jgi:hypothetical protein
MTLSDAPSVTTGCTQNGPGAFAAAKVSCLIHWIAQSSYPKSRRNAYSSKDTFRWLADALLPREETDRNQGNEMAAQ